MHQIDLKIGFRIPIPNKTSPTICEGSFMFAPKKKNESQVQNKHHGAANINQAAAHGFKKNIQEGTCFTKAAVKRIQNHHQRFQRFQVSGIIHQLPVPFMMGGEYTQKSVKNGYKKKGTPFQLKSLKCLLVCPVQRECLIFRRFLAAGAPLHWP